MNASCKQEEAFRLYEESRGNTAEEIQRLSDLSEIHLEEGNLEQALGFSHLALQIFTDRAFEDARLQGIVLRNLASCLLKKNELKRAEELLTVSSILLSDDEKAKTLIQLSQLYLMKDEQQKALSFLKQAKDLAKDSKATEELYQSLSQFHKNNG